MMLRLYFGCFMLQVNRLICRELLIKQYKKKLFISLVFGTWLLLYSTFLNLIIIIFVVIKQNHTNIKQDPFSEM